MGLKGILGVGQGGKGEGHGTVLRLVDDLSQCSSVAGNSVAEFS